MNIMSFYVLGFGGREGTQLGGSSGKTDGGSTGRNFP